MATRTQIGRRIRKARESRELSQEELAKRVGYDSASALSLIESGARGVSPERLNCIADELAYDIGYFLSEEESMPKALAAAFRSTKKLDKPTQKQILSFVEFVKKESSKKRGEKRAS